MPTQVSTASTVVMRAARGSDGPELARLASLDSQRLPRGELIVAEVDGAIVAAIARDGSTVIADPFRPTADIVALLELQAPRKTKQPLSERLGLRPAPRVRTA